MRTHPPLSGGRVTVCLAVCLFAASRAVAYSRLGGGRHESPGPMIISDHGDFIWAWVSLWVLVGALAVADLWTRHHWGIVAMVGMMTAWGVSYLWAWAFSHFHTVDYLTVCTYICPAVVIAALLRALRARVGGGPDAS